jgi:hypothetical protein
MAIVAPQPAQAKWPAYINSLGSYIINSVPLQNTKLRVQNAFQLNLNFSIFIFTLAIADSTPHPNPDALLFWLRAFIGLVNYII